MRLATLRRSGSESAALVLPDGILPLETLNAHFGRSWPVTLFELLDSGVFYDLAEWFRSGGRDEIARLGLPLLDPAAVTFAPLLRSSRKLWGIGLNYVAHAADLAEKAPHEEPASFLKTPNTIVGHGDAVCIPRQSQKTTGEAELGIVFGRRGRDVPESDWLRVVAGFTTVLDLTAEDILRKNPRYLTRSKCFDTFLSVGPVLVTPDEIPDVLQLKVATVLDGRVHAENVVSNMTFPPPFLVSFHSRVFPWEPGDILSTGTPQAVPLAHGNTLECRIDGFPPLQNPVIDLKTRPAS